MKKRPLRIANPGIGSKNRHDLSLFDERQEEYQEPETWTIITALNRVLDLAERSELSDEFWDVCKTPLAYLRQELGLTNIQITARVFMRLGEATRAFPLYMV